MSRTNIVVDDELVLRAMELTGATTRREVVDIALRRLVSRRQLVRSVKGRYTAVATSSEEFARRKRIEIEREG